MLESESNKAYREQQSHKWRCELTVIAIFFIGVVIFAHACFEYIERQPLLFLDAKDISALYTAHKNENINCTSIQECDFKPGDILIRRHLTSETRVVAGLFGSYYTHVALYHGNGDIVEAVGTQADHDDEILMWDLKETDWYDKELEGLVVLRPLMTERQRQIMLDNAYHLADDNTHRFGIGWLGESNQKYTCVSLIYAGLMKAGLVEWRDAKFMSPDYFVNYALEHPEKFSMIGFYFLDPREQLPSHPR